MEDEASIALNLASRLGAEYAEARIVWSAGESLVLKNGSVEAYEYGEDCGIGIRVVVGGALGFASTSRLERESLEEAVEKALKAARASAPYFKRKVELAGRSDEQCSWRVDVKEDPLDVSVEEKMELLVEAERALLSTGAKLPSRLFELATWKVSGYFANTEGASVKYEKALSYLFYSVIAAKPGRGTAHRWRELGASGGWERVREWNVPESVAEEARTLDRILEEGREPPKGVVDLVLGSEVVGIIVHESCGHPSEADRVLGREAAQGGESFIRPDSLGERIGSEHVTIVDDPTIPGSYGYYLYDDEGVRARPRELYKEGVINELLHNRETAAVFGVESNAAARAAGYRYEPLIRMANTYLKPGDYSLEELVEDVKLGVYIKTFMEWNIDDRRWNQRYVGLEAYLIDRGEVKGLVRNPAIEVTTKGLYSRVDAAGRELEFVAGTCGKGEPAQAMPVWMGGPPIRVRGIPLGVVP